jgi:hypothetical protein
VNEGLLTVVKRDRELIVTKKAHDVALAELGVIDKIALFESVRGGVTTEDAAASDAPLPFSSAA